MSLYTDSVTASCPYCGESIELVVDISVPEQQYIEDCFVCCRPIVVSVSCHEGEVSVNLYHENETF